MSTSVQERDERIDLRLSGDLKALLARAASYSGMSLSSFLVAVASDRAREVVAEHETLTLTHADWQAFLSSLDEAERPRPHLGAAVGRYKERRKARDAD